MTITKIQPLSDTEREAARQSRRSDRHTARYLLWEHSTLRRVKACGRYSTSDAGVVVKATGSGKDRRAGLGGVQSCGSVWACPVCSERIQAQRQADVAAGLAVARARGWEVLFLTLTMRHKSAHGLGRLWKQLSLAWRATVAGSGRVWKAEREAYGVQGYLRLIETTHGDNGWHLHVHALLFVDPAARGVLGGLSDLEVRDLGASMFGRWRDSLPRSMRPSTAHGVNIKRVRRDDTIADYFAKGVYSRKGESSTAHDVTGSHAKQTSRGGRTPFAILDDIVRQGVDLVDLQTGEIQTEISDRDLDLWHTWEKASKGKRQMLWSNGLRAALGLVEPELTDEQIVAAALSDRESVLEWLPVEEYRRLARRRLLAQLLSAAEADDTGEALCAFLNRFALKHRTVDPPD